MSMLLLPCMVAVGVLLMPRRQVSGLPLIVGLVLPPGGERFRGGRWTTDYPLGRHVVRIVYVLDATLDWPEEADVDNGAVGLPRCEPSRKRSNRKTRICRMASQINDTRHDGCEEPTPSQKRTNGHELSVSVPWLLMKARYQSERTRLSDR